MSEGTPEKFRSSKLSNMPCVVNTQGCRDQFGCISLNEFILLETCTSFGHH